MRSVPRLKRHGATAGAIASMVRSGIHLDPRLPGLQRDLTHYVATIYPRPASGLWEQRDRRDHYTYSKVMAWLALQHGVAATGGRRAEDLKQKRDRLHRQICRQGFNRTLGSFVRSFGSNKLDASALLLPIFGFLSFEDERVIGTMKLIQKRLSREGLLYRYLPSHQNEQESAFIPCSFWMVQNLAGAGRRVQAERLFERLLVLRNDVGLLSEEYDPDQGRFMGNFPQALSHIALINAARALLAY